MHQIIIHAIWSAAQFWVTDHSSSDTTVQVGLRLLGQQYQYDQKGAELQAHTWLVSASLLTAGRRLLEPSHVSVRLGVAGQLSPVETWACSMHNLVA